MIFELKQFIFDINSYDWVEGFQNFFAFCEAWLIRQIGKSKHQRYQYQICLTPPPSPPW